MLEIFNVIFDFFKSIGELIVSYVQGIFNLGKVANDSFAVFGSWQMFVPTAVLYFLGAGITFSVVLTILGRSHR